MAVDLDQLSREVAAAGDEWMKVGVQVTTDVDCPVLLVFRRHGQCYGVWGDGQDIEVLLARDIVGPNLHDLVTVNRLLGANGQVRGPYGVVWIAVVDGQEGIGNDRTTAICRAWIAARGKQ